MNFLNKNYTKECLTLALPVMLTQVGQVSVNLFDNIIVGKLLGADALASVSLGNAVFSPYLFWHSDFRLLFRRWFQKHIPEKIMQPSILFSAMAL